MIGAIQMANKRFELENQQLWKRGQDLGGNMPSYRNQVAANEFLKQAKAAADGNMAGYLDIQMWMNDIPGTSFTNFDSVHWHNPINAALAVQVNTVQKNFKKGISCGVSLNGGLLSKTFFNTSLVGNKTDIGAMWIWFGLTNIGTRGSGVSIGTSSRAVAIYPKYTNTAGFFALGGESEYNVSDGDAILNAEITTDASLVRRRAYVNNVMNGTATAPSWGADFNAEVAHLGIVITAPSGMGSGSINNNNMILGGFILYRPSIVNRTQLYNAVVQYRDTVNNF